MGLVLKRKAGESIIIDGDIKVTILSVIDGRVKIGIEAPSDVNIVRGELVTEKKQEIPANV